MKKVFKMEELDCANCAAKMEDAIRRIDGVNGATVSFMTQKLTLDVEDGRLDEVLSQAQKACSRIERHCRIIV
ncbi:MAG: cation transporter [Candidatus Fimadaptatus sp.]